MRTLASTWTKKFRVGVAAEKSPAASAKKFIVGPWYDATFFIFSPLIACFVGYVAIRGGGYEHFHTATNESGEIQQIALATLLSSAFTHAHLFIVFFRSHGNLNIFSLHPLRFTLVPVVLFGSMLLSQWAFVVVSVLVTWWDVYHSSLQTFGLGRIYDLRAGNDPNMGRRADYLLNLVLYTGPVLAGTSFAAHLFSFKKFESVDGDFFLAFAEKAFSLNQDIRALVLFSGIVFLAYYMKHSLQLIRKGYHFPIPKLILYVVTGTVSILSWGFGSFGHAFLIMNFFHAFQYFAIVWWSEKSNIIRLFGLKNLRGQVFIALVLFLSVGFGYGFWRVWTPHTSVAVIALSNLISILHFWYDGFIWSVRRNQIPG